MSDYFTASHRDELLKEKRELQERISRLKEAGDDRAMFARNLQRHLNAANERIKRLEAAGDAILNANNDDEQYEAIKQWYKAKEAKL